MRKGCHGPGTGVWKLRRKMRQVNEYSCGGLCCFRTVPIALVTLSASLVDWMGKAKAILHYKLCKKATSVCSIKSS